MAGLYKRTAKTQGVDMRGLRVYSYSKKVLEEPSERIGCKGEKVGVYG